MLLLDAKDSNLAIYNMYYNMPLKSGVTNRDISAQRRYFGGNHKTYTDKIYKQVTYTSPYIGIFEEYTLEELLKFYTALKPLKPGIGVAEFIEIIELNHAQNKAIKHFSSGMKQRVKLGLSILSETPILLLDEPTSNLDKKAIKWYQRIIQDHLNDRIVVVASNNLEEESFFCTKSIDIENYKP